MAKHIPFKVSSDDNGYNINKHELKQPCCGHSAIKYTGCKNNNYSEVIIY